ncbi:protein unc-79 homolog isoform X1 [Drosophila simulans]|uniref:protein unc-79 homolog isoform X1 n=1 Tax=Drosophila simulans TaxID=7240 RepID=UPI00192D022D|nr:protein unc-79 homolog isoform X1 [Drosophila simulans]XP_039151762.1 protein unc-79 homolog isoform X1 [Drosophila simulans]
MTGSFKVQLINMGTRAAAFQAKLRALHEYHVRLLHNVLPAPSGVDIANNIKYFSQTLLTVLKDVRTSPHELIRDPLEDPTRMSAYPNLEYGNLYNALTMLIDVAPCIQYGQIVFGKALLQCLSCILPFLDKDLIDNLPYLVSSTISVLPPALHQCIINALCYYILPFTITRRSSDEQECQACQSVSSVIMMVLQYSNNPAHHCQLLECLMTLKHNVVKDILCVVAYGTAVSRTSAAKLLFYYWPAFNANLFDRKVLLSKLTNDLVPFTCQREHCPNSGNAEAAKVCYDHSISIAYAPDCPPPLYLCIECANEIHREHGSLEFGDILHPMQQVSMVCENKNCRSNEKSAFSICFSTECASFNGNHPIRYCSQCHSNRHNSRRGGDHVVHRSLQPAWQMDPEMQMHMVESVVSLLREAKPLNFEPGKESSSSESKKNGSGITADNISLEERQRLGRYGIWLLVGRCTPTADTPVEVLGRILSMLFHWFHVTAYSYDAAGQVESTIEKLKVDHVCNWLKDICRIHYNVFISCLLPHPPEYARVGGHWETLASRTSHLKEGLQRLICLVPYEVITSEIWDYVMPHWMEAITNDVAEKELNELKIVLSKILDPEMSPLGFDAKTMYNFVAIRFEKTTAKVQQQALHWLQILTKLEILIPLVQLFAMFGDGVRIMKYGIQHELMREKDAQSQSLAKTPKTPCKESKETKADMANPPRRSSISPVVEDDSGNTSAISDDEAPTNRHTEFSTDAEHNLTCCILMLDILLKQMELQDVEQHMGIHTSVCENVSRLIKCMVTAARVGLSSHVCALKVAECAYCEASIMWHQLATKLVQFMAPLNPVRPPDVPIEDIIEEEKSSRKSPPESDKEKTRDRDVSLSMAPLPIPLGPLGGFADIFKLDQFFSDDGKIIIMAGPVPVAVPQPEPHSVGGVLVHMPHVCSNNENGHSVDSNELRKVHATDEIMTATVETVSEQLDLASILPTDRAIARSITLSDADVGSANVSVTKASVMGENGANGGAACGGGENGSGSEEDEEEEDSDDFWHTSVGKFKFTLDTLPQPLQYIHQLLTEIPTIKKPEILYYVLQCLNTMALHGDALAKAAREQRGFFIWCQENLLIKNLWELCNAEHSHICQVGVPLLLHCITLPLGSDVFWRVVQEAFHDTDWRVRFTAVERVTVITRFMDSTPLRSEVGLQTALATAFCHLIASMDDINVYVAQRATLYIGTIHDTAIRSLLFCLESQFDLFIVDRPVVLQSVYQLHNSLSDRKMLGWEFFLNRFDTLFVEAQINLEKCGDISYLRDLRNSDNGSEALSAKIQKAREALSQSDTSGGMAKTLSASFGTKWPYKRTMSAPASMAPRQDSKFVPEKEKIYSRQVSAPILKRKTSRFGLGQFLGSSSGGASGSSQSVNPAATAASSSRPKPPPCPVHQPAHTAFPYHTHHHHPHAHHPYPHPHPHHHPHHHAGSSAHVATTATTSAGLVSTHSQSHQYLVHCVPPSHHSPMPTLQEAETLLRSQAAADAAAASGSFGGSLGHPGQEAAAVGTGTAGGSAGNPNPHHSFHSHFQKHPSAPNLLPPPPAPSPSPSTLAFPMHCTCDAAPHPHPQVSGAAATGSAANPDGHIHSLGGLNDDNLIGLLSRITELEESDRETIHLLVFMLMQFMSRTDQAYPSEEKPMTKTQNIVLKHLFLLLGHNQIDKTFHTTPESLRVSAVFNAFLANLPQVLDQNHLIGGLILPSVMQIILYAPNPTSTSGESYQNIVFNYSLWHLEQYPRRNWLFTLLVVLYKYSYTQPPLSGYVIAGIRLIMNSLRGHFHQCRRIPTTTILDIQGVGGAARSRDVSQPSLGTDPDDKEASPPASPMFPSEGTSAASKSKGNVAFTPKLQHAFRKYNDSSLDADETESELVAIPESDLSDSTLHGSSAPGSFDDTIHFEDVMPRNRRALEYTEEKSTKSHKSMITTKVGDTYTTKIKATTTSETLVTTHTRHSLQEGVRMIVTPLVGAETTETAIVSPPVDVHRAVTVRNKSLENAAASTSKMFAAIATNHLKALGALQDMPAAVERKAGSSSGSGSRSGNGSGNGSGGSVPAAIQASSSAAASKPIGRHKTIVECSAGNSSSSADDSRQKKSQTKSLRRTDKNYGSPDSPLSKMSVMPNPRDEIDESMQSLPPPKSIAALEIPTPERLLPIGTQDTVATLVERVRDGLNLPDISHLKQDSLDVSESTKDDVTPSSRTNSPRRLIKQVALESPPNPNAQLPSQPSADLHTSILKNVQQDLKQNAPEGNGLTTSNSIKRPRQKLAPFNVDSNAIPDIRSRFAGSWPPPPFQPVDPEPDDDDEIGAEASNGHGTHSTPHAPRGSSRRVGDYTIVERCSDCGAHIEEYTDEEIGIFIVILGTFIHREPAMAAPFLPEILTMTSRICLSSTHAWQGENGPPLASSAQAVACQFFRCVLHQLAPNGIFLQVFQTQMKMKIRHHHFRSIAKALQDFQDLNSTSPIYMVCESLTSKKALPIDQLPVIFRNMAEYLNLQCVPTEAGVGLAVWSQAMQAMESLLRQVIVIMPSLTNAEYMLDIMAATLRLNCVPKTLLDPYSKIMAYCVQHTNLEYQTLYELCTLNIRSFSKDRDKNLLCRQMIFEFVQALKFKSNIPDHNLLTIIGFVLLDAGGTLPPGAAPGLPDAAPMMTTNSADCLRQYINDVIDFLADFHTLSKIKNFKNGQTSSGLGEDTLGGVLKGAVAQYLALEMSRGNSRDNKAVSRYLPWLNNAPSSLQQGPKEFTECVGHMRLLSWLLLGSLTHMALMQRRQETHSIPTPMPQQNSQGTGPAASVHYQHQGVTYSQPVPQEASCHIADHIQVIFAGFAEQSKTSVLHMSSLFHAFTLCQLWTVYLEQMAHNTNSNAEGSTLGVLFEFWAKVTPCILQLVSHAKPTVNKDQPQTPLDFQTQSANSKLSEMVNLHFLSLLEALKDTNSTVLGKLLPMWSPVLSSQTQLSDTLHVRLQNVRDYAPDYEEQQTYKSEALLKWLQRLQFKMGQIELQASTATQFYSI